MDNQVSVKKQVRQLTYILIIYLISTAIFLLIPGGGLEMSSMYAENALPDIPPILETTRKWIETDPNGELRRTYIQGNPKVNCQVLLLQRLPPESSWEDLAVQYQMSVSTLSSFYRRQCLPRLREFGESQGYLEDTYHEL